MCLILTRGFNRALDPALDSAHDTRQDSVAMFAANGSTDNEGAPAAAGRGPAPPLGELVAEASSQAVFESLSSVFEVCLRPGSAQGCQAVPEISWM